VRDEFIGLASHELRTPLTSLRLLLQLEQKRPPSPENRAVVMRQVDRLTRLVATMLDTTRLAVGTLAIERQPVDFARVVREAVERVAEKPEQLSVDAPAELQLHGDPLRLGQLVDNLVGNALRYGAGKPVHLRLTQQGAAATLSVRDQGIGFAVADGERIFGPFERAAPSTGYGGLGLGLYLAREIVRAHGGTIHATGAPGAGAEFVVSLPLA
jgi:signal transduction histidine kinase